MLDRISYKQTGVETSWIRFSRPFFGVGIQAKLLSQKRPEGAGYGSFTLMPHVSILAENAEIWPVLINLGPSYYYQFK